MMENIQKRESAFKTSEKHREIAYHFHALKANIADLIDENKKLKLRIEELETKLNSQDGGHKNEPEQTQSHKFTKKMGALFDGASSKLKISRNKTLKVNEELLDSKIIIAHSDCVTDMAVKDNVVISSSFDNSCKIWKIDLEKCLVIYRGHGCAVNSVKISPTDKFYICSGGGDDSIHVWSPTIALSLALELPIENRSRRESNPIENWLDSGDISLGTDKLVYVNKPIFRMKSHKGPVSSVDWMFDGKNIVSGSWDRTLIVWDVEKAKEILNLYEQEGEINYVSCHPFQKIFVSSSCDSSICTWDMRTGKTPSVSICHAHSGNVNSTIFNGNYLISAGSDKIAKVWELRSLREHVYSIKTSSVITRISANSDGNICLPMRNGHFRIWNYANKIAHSIYDHHDEKLMSLEASCWSEFKGLYSDVFTCSIDGSLAKWNIQPAQQTKH